MAIKNSGKNLHFWFGGVEQPVESVNLDYDFPEIDVTDSATVSPGTDIIVGRGKRTLKVSQLMQDVNGTEIITGTLVLGTKYVVTLGTITEGSVTYPVGTLFTSDGTGTASGANKVKPLGAKFNGKNIACTVNAVSTPVTAFKFDEQYGEFDATDSASSGDSTEFITGRVKRTGSIEMIQLKDVADLMSATPAATPVVLTLATSNTITGNAIFKKKSMVSNAKGDMVKVSYDMTWIGNPTVTANGLLAMGTSTAMIANFGSGTSTNKQYSGNGIVVSKSIEADIASPIKCTYSIDFVGVVTEAVAN